MPTKRKADRLDKYIIFEDENGNITGAGRRPDFNPDPISLTPRKKAAAKSPVPMIRHRKPPANAPAPAQQARSQAS